MVATPARAWGRRMLQELRPKMRTERPVSHREAGGLSTVMNEAGSSEPKNQAFHDAAPLAAAAA
jgi:hypothetical protein